MLGGVMELPGETYLFNLSLVAITFTAVSVLVMLMRQTMGGKMSNFDVYLITSYISFGFVQAIGAMLPPLVFLFRLPPTVLWALSSGLAAILVSGAVVSVVHRRLIVSPEQMALPVLSSFFMHGIVIVLLLINATVWSWQGVHLYAMALTLSLSVTMWSFVRRIASLLGDKPSDDWDPKRG